jgi:hypothetical protein
MKNKYIKYSKLNKKFGIIYLHYMDNDKNLIIVNSQNLPFNTRKRIINSVNYGISIFIWKKKSIQD